MDMKKQNMNIFAILVAILLCFVVGWSAYKQIQEHYAQDDPMLHDLYETIRPLFNQDSYHTGELRVLNNRNIMKEINLYKGDKSYTINKKHIHLCLKDENGQYYDKNMLIYVTLHELAHVICDEIGHTDKFHKIFEELLLKANEQKIYDPSIPIIHDYCQYDNDD